MFILTMYKFDVIFEYDQYQNYQDSAEYIRTFYQNLKCLRKNRCDPKDGDNLTSRSVYWIYNAIIEGCLRGAIEGKLMKGVRRQANLQYENEISALKMDKDMLRQEKTDLS